MYLSKPSVAQQSSPLLTAGIRLGPDGRSAPTCQLLLASASCSAVDAGLCKPDASKPPKHSNSNEWLGCLSTIGMCRDIKEKETQTIHNACGSMCRMKTGCPAPHLPSLRHPPERPAGSCKFFLHPRSEILVPSKAWHSSFSIPHESRRRVAHRNDVSLSLLQEIVCLWTGVWPVVSI